jgi:long-chain fatty acid transport protein
LRLRILLAITFSASVAVASPEDMFGFGPRSSSMGATGAAHAEGYEAAYANPALLSRIRSQRLTLGYQAGTFQLYEEKSRVSVGPMKGALVGADFAVPFGGILKDRVGVGLAFYTPSDVVVRGKILYPEKPQFPLLADRAQSLAVRLGIGADIGYGFRIGVGFAALAEIVGTVLVATDATGKVGSRVEDQLIATYAPTVGASYEMKHWRFGAVYRGVLDARFAVAIDATRLSSLNIPVFNIAGIAQYDPAQITLEAAHDRGPWLFALGATYKRWSAFNGILEPTILCPPEEPDCGALQPAKIDFADTLAVRAGVERKIELTRRSSFFGRGGVMFEPSPVPSKLPSSEAYDLASRGNITVPTRFYDLTRWGVTLGAGLEVPPFLVDFYAQFHFLQPRTFELEAATPVKVSGNVLTTGITAGVRF